jgi:hypothetical protein
VPVLAYSASTPAFRLRKSLESKLDETKKAISASPPVRPPRPKSSVPMMMAPTTPLGVSERLLQA